MAGAREAAVTYCEMGIDVRAYAMATPERQQARAGGALSL